jgi:hypothetical protein
MNHGACKLWGGSRKKEHISRRSEEGTVSRLRERLLRNRSLIPGRGDRLTTFPERPDRLWGPTTFLFSGQGGLFPGGLRGRNVKLTAHFHLVPRLRMRGAILPLPNISSWGTQDATFQLYFHSMYCVLVVWLLPTTIMNTNKIKSVTESETAKVWLWLPYVCLFSFDWCGCIRFVSPNEI